jgi:hypothetical protein
VEQNSERQRTGASSTLTKREQKFVVMFSSGRVRMFVRILALVWLGTGVAYVTAFALIKWQATGEDLLFFLFWATMYLLLNVFRILCELLPKLVRPPPPPEE